MKLNAFFFFHSHLLELGSWQRYLNFSLGWFTVIWRSVDNKCFAYYFHFFLREFTMPWPHLCVIPETTQHTANMGFYLSTALTPEILLMCYVKSKLCMNIWTHTEVICLLFMFLQRPCSLSVLFSQYFVVWDRAAQYGIDGSPNQSVIFFLRLVIKLANRLVLLHNFSLHLWMVCLKTATDRQALTCWHSLHKTKSTGENALHDALRTYLRWHYAADNEDIEVNIQIE